MVDVPAVAAFDDADMPVLRGLPEKLCYQRSPQPADKTMVLPTQEVARMHGDQIEERGFPFQVTDGLKRRDGIVVQRHRSRMFSMRWLSYSILALSEARSADEA